MATYFDLDEVADKECGVPHTLPSSSALKMHLKDLDISVHDSILIYDDFSVLGSARAWWTFKVLGFKSRDFFLDVGLSIIYILGLAGIASCSVGGISWFIEWRVVKFHFCNIVIICRIYFLISLLLYY